MHIKMIYISVQGKSIGNIQKYEALEGVYSISLSLYIYQNWVFSPEILGVERGADNAHMWVI
jgi:hypothetical protein